MALLTAVDVFHLADPAAHEQWIRTAAANLRASGHPCEPETIRPITEISPDRPAYARVNHGRWLADCPNRDAGALLLVYGQPFMCPYCCNADLDGRWRAVVWPTPAMGQRIEAALEARLFAHNRNWAGEPVSELMAENEAHPESVRQPGSGPTMIGAG